MIILIFEEVILIYRSFVQKKTFLCKETCLLCLYIKCRTKFEKETLFLSLLYIKRCKYVTYSLLYLHFNLSFALFRQLTLAIEPCAYEIHGS